MIVISSSLAGCEARLERQRRGVPTVAVVGASYTAGVGPDNPVLSWAVLLAGRLRWNAVVYGVPGAGYANPGNGGRGPVDRMIAQERLRALRPALVIVQAGLGDRGEPGRARDAAGARHRRPDPLGGTRGADRADHHLHRDRGRGTPWRCAARPRDRDRGKEGGPGDHHHEPAAGRWRFPRQSDGLHPTAAGDAWIAGKVGSVLAADGVRAASVAATVPEICDASVGVTTPPATDRDA